MGPCQLVGGVVLICKMRTPSPLGSETGERYFVYGRIPENKNPPDSSRFSVDPGGLMLSGDVYEAEKVLTTLFSSPYSLGR
jgi:hypothetical protein